MNSAVPLVCLHGWGMNLRVFDLLQSALREDCETMALDLPGHGRRPWQPDNVRFDSQLEVIRNALPPRCVLLGWSFGGKIAMELAVRHPQRIAALVLVSTTPKFAQSADWPFGLTADAMQAFRTVLEQDWQQTLRDFIWLQLRGSRNAEEAQRALESALAEQGAPQPEALRADLDLLAQLDLRDTVPRITQPVLLLCGQNDRVSSPGAVHWMAEQLPQSRLVEIPRAGHAPFASHVEEVATPLREFLAAQVGPQP